MMHHRKHIRSKAILWVVSSSVATSTTTNLRREYKDRAGHRNLFHLNNFDDPQSITVKEQGMEATDVSSNTEESLERNNPVIHFVTYGGSHSSYHRMAAELAKEAYATGWFETVTAYTENDIPSWAATKYAEILSEPRGGYWIWRFPILQQKASEIQEGEFILYLDSDIHFRTNDNSDLLKWTNILNDADQGILLFPHPFTEEHWTTENIFMAFGIPANDTAIRKSDQLQGSVQLLRKCKDLDDYFTLVYCVLDKDPWIITDRYNEASKLLGLGFSGKNRHDQSISSVAQKVRGAIIAERIWFLPTAPFSWPG